MLLIIASSILALTSMDMMLPSLPHIADFFAVPEDQAKMLISVFMIGQFATVLFWGIVADQIGKRLALFLGMALFFIGSVLSIYASSMYWLLICRFIQGAGAVVVPVAGWALIQDLYPKDDSARIMAVIGTLISVVPLFAPVVGGKIDVLFGWQAILYCIAAYSFVLCILMLLHPQYSLTRSQRVPLSLKAKLGIYALVLKNRTFVAYISLFGLLNCGEWCFLTVAPFYYAHEHMRPDHVGILLMLAAFGYVVGSALASKLLRYFGVDKVILWGIWLALLSSLALLIGHYLSWASSPLFNTALISLYILSSALLWSTTTSRALQCFEEHRAAASAMRSLLLLCFSSFGTLFGRIIHHDSLHCVSIFLLGTALCAIAVFHHRKLSDEALLPQSP